MKRALFTLFASMMVLGFFNNAGAIPFYEVTSAQIKITTLWNRGADNTINIMNSANVPLDADNWFYCNIKKLEIGDLFLSWNNNFEGLIVTLAYNEFDIFPLILINPCFTMESELQNDGGISPAPEPATMALFGIGLIGVVFVGKKKFGN